MRLFKMLCLRWIFVLFAVALVDAFPQALNGTVGLNDTCADSGSCGVGIPPFPPSSPPQQAGDNKPNYDINCKGSKECTRAGCAGPRLDNIIEILSYMKPTAEYGPGEQMACAYCKEYIWGEGKWHGICAWLEAPKGQTMTIDRAWMLLKAARRNGCTMCTRNPTKFGEIRVDYSKHISGNCSRNYGWCKNYEGEPYGEHPYGE